MIYLLTVVTAFLWIWMSDFSLKAERPTYQDFIISIFLAAVWPGVLFGLALYKLTEYFNLDEKELW